MDRVEAAQQSRPRRQTQEQPGTGRSSSTDRPAHRRANPRASTPPPTAPSAAFSSSSATTATAPLTASGPVETGPSHTPEIPRPGTGGTDRRALMSHSNPTQRPDEHRGSLPASSRDVLLRYPHERSPAFSPRVAVSPIPRAASTDASRGQGKNEFSTNWRERHQKRMDFINQLNVGSEKHYPHPIFGRVYEKYSTDPSIQGDISLPLVDVNQSQYSGRLSKTGPSEFVLNYMAKNIIEIPREVFEVEDLLKLNISQNQIRVIGEKFGKSPLHTSLIVLDASDNLISRLPSSFSNISTLKELTLSNNHINTLDGYVFLGMMDTLEFLKINWNKLEYLPKGIGDLGALRYFDASCNQISLLPPNIDEMGSLRTMFMGQNKISCLPEQFCRISTLEYLDFSGNPLFSSPPPIPTRNRKSKIKYDTIDVLDGIVYYMPNMYHLSLCSVEMKALNPHISLLSCLRELKLAGNDLSHLPDSLLSCKYLDTLDASRNKITRLPEDIGISMTRLSFLDMSSNKLDALPDTFTCLRNSIKCLDLRFNHLQSYSDTLVEWARAHERTRIELRVDNPF